MFLLLWKSCICVSAVKKQAFYNGLRANAHTENFAIERASQLFSSQDNYIDQIANVSASDVAAAAKKLTDRLSIASYGNINAVPYVDTLWKNNSFPSFLDFVYELLFSDKFISKFRSWIEKSVST